MSWRAGSSGFTGAHTGTTLGFYSVTPTTRPAAYTQTFSTASRTVPNATAAAVDATAATNVTPFGYTAAQADGIIAAVNALRTDVDAVRQVVTAVIDDLQAVGLLQ